LNVYFLSDLGSPANLLLNPSNILYEDKVSRKLSFGFTSSKISKVVSDYNSGNIMITAHLKNLPLAFGFGYLNNKQGDIDYYDNNAVHLGERDCSIQRRHQKVIEIAPSPLLNEGIRNKLYKISVDAMKELGYESVGTVEFLVDGLSREPVPPFYFLEINARIQVEHPVTEMVYGVDLIKEQIRIAARQPLKLKQERLIPRGVALECRIYAEDSSKNFLPSIGRLTRYIEPSGKNIRVDSGVVEGSEILQVLLPPLSCWGAAHLNNCQRLVQILLW